MSFHIFISRPGFKSQPIPEAEWLMAARNNSQLVVTERTNRNGLKYYEIKMVGTAERLALTPYGLIDAQDPSQRLVEVMFELAASLGAAVYSERLKPYASIADWVERTSEYRRGRTTKLSAFRRQRRLRLLLWLALISASAAAGWFLSARNAA